MRNLVSIMMVLALVITTTVAPAVSQAMPHEHAKAVQTEKAETPAGHDCHGHGKAKADVQQNTHKDKHTSNDCCEKGMCKCVGGTCHSGLSKIFGNSANPWLAAISSKTSGFAFDDQLVDSGLPNRLKRPPKA